MENKKRRDTELLYVVDNELYPEHLRCRAILHELNTAPLDDVRAIAKIVKRLLGKSDGAAINPPFHCDYGYNIEVGRGFFANYNCTILDVGRVTIGDNCLLGPNVAIYTAGHPIDPALRTSGLEYGISVSVGNNVWIGGNSVICPGVNIGDDVVIGAGSVVTKDIPSGVIAAGNPARVIRAISDDDRKYYFKKREIDPEALAYFAERLERGDRGDKFTLGEE